VTQRPVVTLYTKRGCHLCEQAEALLATVARTQSFAVQKVDIESSPALFEVYRYRVPVIEIAGGPTFEWPTTAERVCRALQAVADAGPAQR
jgi:glutaredoxin